MFCPKCAVENHDETRYCRSCGTDLEIVVRALNTRTDFPSKVSLTGENRIELAQQQLQLKAGGINRLVQGALVFLTGMLLGIPLYLFSDQTDWHRNWILIWLIFCGWIPVAGALMIGKGLSKLIQSRMTQQRIDWLLEAKGASLETDSVQTRRFDQFTADRSDSPSAAERTTASMNDPVAGQ